MTLYLGVDPGRSKTGLALVRDDGSIMRLHIAKMDSFEEELLNFCQDVDIVAVVLGDGTNSAYVAQQIARLFPALEQNVVGEAYSTEEARKLYWEVNPPKGWRKLVPLGLLVPDEPMDAYAAVVQVRRWLKIGENYE